MKLALNLTFEDGMKVVEAMKETAIENGWDAEELDESGVIEEYSNVVDVALAAMGIEVHIAGEPEAEAEAEDDPDEDNVKVFEDGDFYDYYFDHYFDNDEEDEEEEENDDDSCRYSLTPKGEFALRYMEAGHTFEEACEVADMLFGDGE